MRLLSRIVTVCKVIKDICDLIGAYLCPGCTLNEHDLRTTYALVVYICDPIMQTSESLLQN